MKFARVAPNMATYLGKDRADVDHLLWSVLMQSHAALAPTGDWVKDLDNMLHNRSPRLDQKIRVRDREVSASESALTAPKCYSVMELTGLDPLLAPVSRESILPCLDLVSMLAAPEGNEPDGTSNCALATGASGQRLTKGDLPHRHCHLLVLSLAYHPVKGWFTGANLRWVLQAADVLQSLFQHGLAWGAGRLGYSIIRRGKSFDFEQFPRALVERFSSGKRDKEPGVKQARQPEEFARLQASWLDNITPDERVTLEALTWHELKPVMDFGQEFVRSINQQFRDGFVISAVGLAAKALQDGFGRTQADVPLVARCTLGQLPDGVDNISKLIVGDRLCYADRRALAGERGLFGLIQSLPRAGEAWCSPTYDAGWWAEPLKISRHRVAILRGPFEADEQDLLKVQLSGSDGRVKVLTEAEIPSIRAKAPEIEAHLKAGGRILFVADTQTGSDIVWLDRLPRYADVAVWRRPKGVPSISAGPGSFLDNIRLHTGSAVEIFAREYAHQPKTLLLCPRAEVPEANRVVRRLRRRGLSRRPSEMVTRPSLVETTEAIRPGHYVHFRRNTDGIPANQKLLVREVRGGGLLVERPDMEGLPRLIDRSQVPKLRVCELVRKEVAAGDIVRILWNAPDVRTSGVRRDRRFTVTGVERDGTLHFPFERALAADSWHWDYDYCAPVEGPVLPGQFLLVLAAKDLADAVASGWVRPRVKVRLCSPDHEAAERALQSVFSTGRPRPAYLQGVDIISEELATASFGLDEKVNRASEPEKPMAQDVGSLPTAEPGHGAPAPAGIGR
jgi:hypothetical protein